MNSFVSMNAIIETYYRSGTYFTQGEEASTCLRINVGWVKKGVATIKIRRHGWLSLRVYESQLSAIRHQLLSPQFIPSMPWL